MPLTGITCPDGVSVPIGECFTACRMAGMFPCGRCVPLPILKAMFGHEREIRNGVYSTTELIAPTRSVYLRRTTDFAESAEDAHFRTYGTAMHVMLTNDADEHLAEVRLRDDDDADSGGGQIDLYHYDEDTNIGVLMDLKVTGAYKVGKILKAGSFAGGESLDWAIQINRYRMKLETAGFTVSKMVVVLMVRDWDYRQRRAGVPKVVQVEVNRISDHWLDRYFSLKRAALDAAHYDGYTPPCRAREIWGGNRCKGYCPVVGACREMSDAAGEMHPHFGWPSQRADDEEAA